MTFNSELFSTRLKTEKAIFKLTVRQAAKEIGISAPTFSRLTKGNIPDLLSYAKCCKWLGMGMDKFIQKH